jgi:biopolymer transport protein ExbD
MTLFLIILIVGGLLFFGLVALIAGIVALTRINRSDGRLRGRGFAIAAIVIGALMLLGLPLAAVVATPVLLMLNQGDAVIDAPVVLPPPKVASAAEARALWKLRGGRVVIAGREEEVRAVAQALDPKARQTVEVSEGPIGGGGAGTGNAPDALGGHPRLDARELGNAETVILADLRVRDRAEARDLTSFVKRGGQLVVMARARGEVFPQDLWPADGECPLPVRRALSELASGMVAIRRIRTRNEKLITELPAGESVVGMGGGGATRVARRLELEKPPAGTATWAVGRDGKPMIVAADFGKGRSVLVATTPVWGELKSQPGFADLVRKLAALKSAGATRPEAGERVPITHEEDPPPAVGGEKSKAPVPAKPPVAQLVVDVNAKGEYRVGNVLLDRKALKAKLLEAANSAGSDKGGLSKLKVRIRATADAPYAAVQKVMVACMDAKVWRLSFAGEKKPAVATPLPKDEGPSNVQKAVRRLDEVVLKVGVTSEKPPKAEFRIRNWKTNSKRGLVQHLARLRSVADVRVTIDAGQGCPFKYVMQALDACAQAKLTKVEFRAPPAPNEGYKMLR